MKRWFKYVKPYWPYFILGPLCMITEVIGEVLMPKFLSMIVDETPTADSVWSVAGIAARRENRAKERRDGQWRYNICMSRGPTPRARASLSNWVSIFLWRPAWP